MPRLSRKRKAVARAKHYLFDLGVARHLARGNEVRAGNKAFGDAFEHFVILELRAYLSYARRRDELRYWRSTTHFEVDALIGDHTAIEIKSTPDPTDKHLKGLRMLKEEGLFERFYLVSTSDRERVTEDDLRILPWRRFIELLWSGNLFPKSA